MLLEILQSPTDTQSHTAKKYADSPGPALPLSSVYVAYGGPHALVSSPRVGCSILITSALPDSQISRADSSSFNLDGGVLILGSSWHTRGRRASVWHMAGGRCQPWSSVSVIQLTPAKTLVMSRTLIPASARLAAS